MSVLNKVAHYQRKIERSKENTQVAKYGTGTTSESVAKSGKGTSGPKPSTSTSGASTSGSSHRATASALEYYGGAPYDILKPILQHATPDQLLQLEFYNRYLVADTDELWEFHCHKDFPTGQRLSDESAREMYLRCTDEREAKLKALHSNIQQAFANSTPVRKTKLAYVDDVAEPPRNVARQQAKYGTGTTSESVAKSGKGTSGPKPSTSTSGASTSGSSHRATASALEYYGGAPYDILKPILQHATPDQLLQLEFYNRYLVADTDELWEFHCHKDFPTGQRLSDESAREMYLRCTDEREAKLKALHSNIQQAFANSTPVRKTKLAYVDDVAEPPRNVARQQAKYGTGTTSESVAKSGKGTSGPKPSTSTSGASTSGSSHRATASALEYYGGAPYDILKPILQHATPDQLLQLEFYNRYLVADTDELWEFHCHKDFPTGQRLSDESAREMYLRCTDKREAKLKALHSNIQQAFANSTPVRKTKLAYVDDVAEPPRNVARQQAKYGTGTTSESVAKSGKGTSGPKPSTSTSGASTSGSSHRATASALECYGGAPYDILKPILQHATPDQLLQLEFYNRYLVADTDELWEFHCHKDFPTGQRLSDESAREMYLRCTDEREAKLKALHSNIQQAFANSTPVRKTKLAYVDDVAEPPRNVARQQAKYGTGTTSESVAKSGKGTSGPKPSTSTSGASTSGSSHRATASALECYGGAPYDILKPILQHATPDQLLQLEFYNRYLVADTDELWEFHCHKDFPTGQRLSDESAREMYLRCTDEREAKLKALHSNIQQAFANSTPVRKTKLAYVDDVAEPPRNVARQQAKYGTGTTSESVAKSGKGTSGPKPSTSTSGASTSGSSHRATASDTTSMASSEEEDKEDQVVCLSAWLRKPNVKGFFTCREVEADGYLSHISQLLVTDSHIYVLRTIPGEQDEAWIVVRRPLEAILGITQKKSNTELRILKYGIRGNLVTLNIDRFIITHESSGTKLMQILKQLKTKEE